MYLLYVDESGSVDRPETEHVVLGGIAVHEADVRPLGREVEAVVTRHLDPHLRTLELHAQHMRKGKGGWRGVPRSVRDAILADLGGLVATFSASKPYAAFAVVREPGAVPSADPLERIYEELALRFNKWVKKNPVNGERQLGMVIGDEAKYEKIVQPLVHDWRTGDGTRFGRLTRLVEVPLFVDSAASRIIQIADFIAHGTWLAYEQQQTAHLDAILPAFGAGGPLHTFVHLNPGHASCSCHPCASRRAPSLPGIGA